MGAPTVLLRILATEDGSVHVDGVALGDPIQALGLLEIGKEAVKQHGRRMAENRSTLVKAGAIPGIRAAGQ